MRSNWMKSLPVITLAAAAGITAAAMAQTKGAGPFTEAQATAGADAFRGNCAACHGANLAGSGEAPQLAGPNFFGNWAKRPGWRIAQPDQD